MLRVSVGTLAGAAALALCGCSHKQEARTINGSMTAVMEPEAERIWNIVSSAYNDIGDALVPQKLSDADWKALEESSRKIKERAEFLATADRVVVAGPNEPILGSQAVGIKGKIGPEWEAVSAETIQKRIDAKPDLFKQKARDLRDAADGMNRAAQNHDAALLYKVASNLDEVCDACHEPFWGTDEPPPASGPAHALEKQILGNPGH